MARAERKPGETGGDKKQRRDRGPPTHAFTVEEFCDAHRISRARYYELKKKNLAPAEMIVGRLRIISAESAAAWRRAREREASTA